MPVPTPTVELRNQFTDAVLVTNTVAGARVSLYQNRVWFAWADAASTATRIPLPVGHDAALTTSVPGNSPNRLIREGEFTWTA
jgi:hypothetical protein